MDTKPKARSPTKRAAKKMTPTPTPTKSQSERFIETARMLGVDETGLEFDRALKIITPPKRARRDRG